MVLLALRLVHPHCEERIPSNQPKPPSEFLHARILPSSEVSRSDLNDLKQYASVSDSTSLDDGSDFCVAASSIILPIEISSQTAPAEDTFTKRLLSDSSNLSLSVPGKAMAEWDSVMT